MIWRAYKYLQHQFYLKHIHGHGIHSPYLFNFVHGVLFNREGDADPVPESILRVHRAMRKDCSLIQGNEERTYGTGTGSGSLSIKSFVKGSSVSMKYGSMLYRITRWFRPEGILELGSGLGISTAYLAGGSPETDLHSIEGSKLRSRISEHTIKRCQLTNVKVHCGAVGALLGDLLRQLPGRFVAFVDADHRPEATLSTTRELIAVAGEEAVIILDDIHWSKEMNRAWKKICSWAEVRGSIDLFQMGILLLRKDIEKTHMKINF